MEVGAIVVGAGRWGLLISQTLNRLGALRGIVERDPDKARSAGERLGVAWSPDVEVALGSDVPAIIVATDASNHADVAVRAFQAGKHVLVEKPLALTVADARVIAAAHRNSNRVGMVGHLMAHHPAFQQICRMVDDGAIGALLHVETLRQSRGPIRRGESVLQTLAPHDLSMALRLFAPTVLHLGSAAAIRGPEGQFDAFLGSVRAPDYRLFAMNLSRIHPRRCRRLTLIGSDGALVFDESAEGTAGLLTLFSASGTSNAVGYETTPALDAELLAFLKAVEAGGPVLTPIAEGLLVTEMIADLESLARSFT